MNKAKKKAIILGVVCLIILLGAIIGDRLLSKSYLSEIKYNVLMDKINKKEDFIILISQTTCSHCMDYKPKLEKVANKYKIMVYYLEADLLSGEEEIELKKHLSFRGTPQTIFVVNGEEKTAATRIDGDVSEEKIISKFKSNGYIK